MSPDAERTGDPSPRAPGTPSETEDEREALLHQLRDANEQLVVSSMRAQGLADEAEVSRTDAEAANRLKDEFLATVSHELRTPLNAVLGWARLLAGGQLDPARTTAAVHIIERNAKALARIIDDLLDISRIIGGGVRIEAQPVDLVAVIQGAIDEVQPAAQAKPVRLTFTCRIVPDPVGGDTIRLQQVVANLLSNAIKFTPPGGLVAVTLTSAGSHAEIQVSDSGQGIDAAFLPRIFDRFSQADTSTARRHGGLGLGLAIVRALVERHGGNVQAASPGPGQGATFTVRLPVLPGREVGDAEGRDSAEMSPAAGTPTRLDGIRVVLVEDDDDGRDVLTIILELAGAKVASARSVREALVVLDTIRPDVIVSDIGMPDEDGFALIRQVRAREAEGGGRMPAIALTGYVYPEDRARLLAAGFQTHLLKPVEAAEIVAAVASLVATRGRA
jgi:signal transduction histidine kinase/ActR/RegA family two-component response regulator